MWLFHTIYPYISDYNRQEHFYSTVLVSPSNVCVHASCMMLVQMCWFQVDTHSKFRMSPEDTRAFLYAKWTLTWFMFVYHDWKEHVLQRGNWPFYLPIWRVLKFFVYFFFLLAHDLQRYICDLIMYCRQNVIFRVTCSKGTYIRSLCADFGKALGG